MKTQLETQPQLSAKGKFLLEKISSNAKEIKSQYLKQQFAANYLHQLQLSGESDELAILPTEVKQDKLYLVYALLEELSASQ